MDASRMYPTSYGVSNSIVNLPDLRKDHCACSFMKCLYVFGGYLGYRLNTCFKYNLLTGNWVGIASLKKGRCSAACSVYEGRMVVSGGFNKFILKSVEAYDHHENKWTNLPDMIEGRWCHGSVSMGNKMFVIGGWNNLTCKVFDSSSGKFTNIKQLLVLNYLNYYRASVVSIGNNVLFFYSTKATAKKNFKFRMFFKISGI